jgi:hypothetical protein
MMNALKYYYWVVPPRAPSTYTPKAISKWWCWRDIICDVDFV